MHVEADLLSVCGPPLVAEAVHVFAIQVSIERVVAVGSAGSVDDVVSIGIEDLHREVIS